MKAAEFTVPQLKVVGYTVPELRAGGFGFREFWHHEEKSPAICDPCFSAQELTQAGVAAADIKEAVANSRYDSRD
jgi:hypothetical protein